METGITLLELCCHLLTPVSLLVWVVQLGELSFVVPLLLDQLVSIAVILQLLLSIVILTSLWEKQSMWDCIMKMEVEHIHR